MQRIVLAIIFTAFSMASVAQSMQTDEALVNQTLNNYIEGRNNGDTARLASAFHPEADLRYVHQQTGKFTIWKASDYVSGFAPGRKLNCTGKIISINIAGNAAQAKVELYYPDRTYADYFNLLKLGGKWVIASKIFSLYPPMKKILFVITSHEKLGETGKRTGFHLGEVAQAYKPFTDAGYDVDFASPAGGRVFMYGVNPNDEVDAWFLQNKEATLELFNSSRLVNIDASKYAAIYFVGGHGAMWDLSKDSSLARIAKEIYENKGVVGAVCHGPAALVNIRLSNGSYLVNGKKLAAFTNAEEKETGLDKVVPFLLQDELTKKGAQFASSPNWQANVQADERLVTGQNPASAKGVALEMIRLLGERK